MDAVCRPCVDKRSPYGWKCRVGSERFSFDRSVYDRIYFAVFIGRHFYCTAFRSFQKHMKIVRYTVKIGGVLMVLMGLLMFTGKMNDITGYLSSAGQKTESGKQENGKKQDERMLQEGMKSRHPERYVRRKCKWEIR